ncbi:MAG: hypothetical protein GXO60_04465 [Epsilonproteobacteria bacterium]|nr:hypothetical protein [Campylobacterota bacterium]
MRKLFLIMLLSLIAYSSNLSTLYHYYEKQEYDKGCDYAMKYYSKNKNDEKFVALYGLSCLETNNIHRIATPMIVLKDTKSSRENASYFGTILLQKQLLKQAILDGKDLSNLRLPKTNFVLSKIFNLFVDKKYTLKDGVYRLKDSKDKDMSYQVYLEKDKKDIDYMIIDIYEKDKFIKRYRYK